MPSRVRARRHCGIARPHRQEPTLQITRTSLFESPTLQIGLFEAPRGLGRLRQCQRQDRDLRGAAAGRRVRQADAPGRQVLGTPSHAVFVAADTAFRISYPGGIGDRALTLRFGEELAPGNWREMPSPPTACCRLPP